MIVSSAVLIQIIIIKKTTCKVAVHFNKEKHQLFDFEFICNIDDKHNIGERLITREAFWCSQLRALQPYGLNKRSEFNSWQATRGVRSLILTWSAALYCERQEEPAIKCQSRNTVRKIGKYRNTVLKLDEIPIPQLWSVLLLKVVITSRVSLSQVCTHQQSTSAMARKREKISNWSVQPSIKARLLDDLGFPTSYLKILTWMNSTAIPWRLFSLIPNSVRTVSQKDEKPHTTGLDDTATPQIKIKIPKYRLKKSSIPQYRKPPDVKHILVIFHRKFVVTVRQFKIAILHFELKIVGLRKR